MLMHRQLKNFSNESAPSEVLVNSLLTAETFTPLSERLSKADALVSAGVTRLKALLKPNDFESYIESLLNICQQEATIWMIVDSEMQRSIMERNLMPAIQQAFGLSDVRILVSRG